MTLRHWMSPARHGKRPLVHRLAAGHFCSFLPAVAQAATCRWFSTPAASPADRHRILVIAIDCDPATSGLDALALYAAYPRQKLLCRISSPAGSRHSARRDLLADPLSIGRHYA